MDLERLEALALADDRAAALAGLLPGTPEHDYWRGVHLQHRGELDEVDALLAAWKRRRDDDALHARLARRQLLLRAGLELRHAEKIRFEAGVRLDDEAEAVAAAAQRYPTRLDPALLDEAALVKDALGRASDLSYVTDWALADLARRPLDATQRRSLLQRLTQAGVPGLVEHVVADLAEKSSRGFGSLPIHSRLTLAQLHALAAAVPELRKASVWVGAVLARLRPPAHVDWRHDPDARAAYLAALAAFVEPLTPAFNALKAQVLYHQLDLDRRRGRYDRERFLRYLALPRKTGYARAERLRGVPAGQLVELDHDAAAGSGLEVVGDDEALVREYLGHFLLTEEGREFAEHLRDEWLSEQLAVVRLLAGAPDGERWAALLGQTRLAALRERVDIELTARNPARLVGDVPAALEVDVKNVPRLVVKVYRIDALAYFLARGDRVDTSVDLDGLVASDEQVILREAPAIRRERLQIALPSCARPGTYVVELIGGGKSSRALLQRGGLRYTLRIGAAGPTLRVLDERGAPALGARIWLGGREFVPREDGAITIPFSTAPARVPMLLVHGDVAQLELLDHPAEHYHFSAGFHLERESLVPGKTARILVRPSLLVAGWPAPISLVESPRVDISVATRAQNTSSKTQPIELRDDAEALVELHVPEDAAQIVVTLSGQVRVVSTQKTLDLSDRASAPIGLIHGTPQVEALHLARTDGGHVLYLLGKTGEPRPGRALALTFKHLAVTFEVALTLETDAEGRIELGALPGIERVSATFASGERQSWDLRPEPAALPAVHALAGASLVLPGPLADAPSLVELRDAVPAHDRSALVSRSGRNLVVSEALPPGDYLLQRRGAPDLRISLLPAASEVAEGWASAGPRSLEISRTPPLLAECSADDQRLTLRLTRAYPSTRVHVLATRYLPSRVLPRGLARPPRAPLLADSPPALSHYVSGRDIGDEYRYVLERKNHPRRPGVLLEKPGLLLNPWSVRATATGAQQARGGGGYAAGAPRPASAPAPATQVGRAEPDPGPGAFAGLDFLPAAARVLANLRPDEHGELSIPRADLGDAQHVLVIVVDPVLTTSADLALPERGLSPRDLRLRLALDHERHFREERRVDGAPAGAVLVVDDLRSGKLELVDTSARALQVLLSLGAPEALREFSFLTEWHALDERTRRARYSKYACHEVHLFLYFRDPDFFARVVRPYLAHKRRKTFLDRWLLGEDLAEFRDPWAFGRLNALERVLLARRTPALRDSIARLLGDQVDLIPPDPERDARVVDTLLGSTALEGDGVVAFAAAEADKVSEEKADERPKLAKRRARPRDEADDEAEEYTLRSIVADAAPAAPPPPSRGPAAPARRVMKEDSEAPARDADLRARSRSAPLYRSADKTQEWAESDWWRVRAADAGPDLIPLGRFWQDLARHDAGPFLSPHLGDCTGSLAAALCALAVLDLPFVAGAHAVATGDARLTLTCASACLAARTRVAELEPGPRTPILVGQNYFRADDRWQWEGAEQREKYAEGELLAGVVYQCQVVVTNPTARAQKLAVLLQIPRGAVPVDNGFYTRTVHYHIHPYGTQAIEYAFYFPAAGRWTHFPAHVTREGELVAFAEPRVLDVVLTPSAVDASSWAHISQHGALDEVLAFLAVANLGRVELEKIAWRMKQRDAFERVLALLASRHVYCDRLWAYALRHRDRARIGEWLRHQDAFLRPAGPVLERAVVDLDAQERTWYEHLEYAPLIGARAHQLGARRQIVNDALATQYRAFLELVAHRAAPTADDLLAAAHYLFCLDRHDDALALLPRVDPAQVGARMQYDYLAAYAACCRGDLAAARVLAAPWRDHPVDRWRGRFAGLLAVLDEAEGRGLAVAVDDDSRDQRMSELAARQPALDLSVEPGVVILQHLGLAACELRFYRMDLELLFSRQPFVQGEVERFSWIEPGARQRVELAGDGRTRVPLPEDLRGASLVIEALAPGLRRGATYYAHDLAVELAHQYGQVRVLRASTQAPLPATYVKVYARARGGGVSFYKDGYTDLRGRFDYVSLSTDDLDRVERFAILVATDDAGATVLEAAPPPR